MKIPASFPSSAAISPQWTPRPPITIASPLVGRHVRVDPFCADRDIQPLWDALGGSPSKVNKRLRWYGMPDMSSEQDLTDVLESAQAPEGCLVTIFRLLGGEQEEIVAGMASYIATDRNHGTTEVGYVAHGEAMARTVAATEAHYLLAQHAFETMGYRRYEWKCDANNLPSANAALRYGFTFEGRFRQHRVTAKGTNRDTNWYSIIDEEWPHRKAAMEGWLDPSNFDESGQQKRKLESFRNEM